MLTSSDTARARFVTEIRKLEQYIKKHPHGLTIEQIRTLAPYLGIEEHDVNVILKIMVDDKTLTKQERYKFVWMPQKVK